MSLALDQVVLVLFHRGHAATTERPEQLELLHKAGEEQAVSTRYAHPPQEVTRYCSCQDRSPTKHTVGRHLVGKVCTGLLGVRTPSAGTEAGSAGGGGAECKKN